MSAAHTSEAHASVTNLWELAGLADAPPDTLQLPDAPQLLPSSFEVGLAAQASIGAAAGAALAIYQTRTGHRQSAVVSKSRAEYECTGYFKLNGVAPQMWEKFSGLYATQDGYVRVHANFEHHRDGVLQLLELGDAADLERADVEAALSTWQADAFEDAANERGLVVSKLRSFDEWDQHPHARWSRTQPLFRITRLDDGSAPTPLTESQEIARPLAGARVLDLTRILAGPICGRTLAAYGADVMLINSPKLPNIDAIIDTSRGKRSVHLDLHDSGQRDRLLNLVSEADVFVQGYRPGGLAALGFEPSTLAERRPGIVTVSLSAYGWGGPWSNRRGFDSLVQTATGFNHAEAAAAGSDRPKALPVQILDYASGFLMAFGVQAALLRRAQEGGSWHVEVSLLQTANWLRSLGRLEQGFGRSDLRLSDHLEAFPTTDGQLLGMPHAAQFSKTPAHWLRPSVPHGADPPHWPDRSPF